MMVNVSKEGYMLLFLSSVMIVYSVLIDSYGYQFKVALLLLALLIFLYSFVEIEKNLALNSLKIKRSIEVLEDEKVSEIVLNVSNRSAYPLFFEIEDSPPKRFRVVEEPKWRVMLGGKTSTKLRYKVVPSPGLNRFGHVRVLVSDPFRLFSTELKVDEIEMKVAKVPPRPKYIVKVRALESQLIGLAMLGRRRGRGTAFLYVRDYVEGDELRYIDWKAFARHNKLLVKVFESESHSHVAVVLVLDKNMNQGFITHVFDSSLRLTASLVYEAIRSGARVKLIVISGRGAVLEDVESTKGSYELLMDLLSRLEPPEHEADKEVVKTVLRNLEGRGNLVYLVTSREDVIREIVKLFNSVRAFYVDIGAHTLKDDMDEIAERTRDLKNLYVKGARRVYVVFPNEVV